MDWISLIVGILGPMLMQCFQKTSTEDPRAFLKDHYDPTTDTFSGSIVEDSLPQTYRAIRIARRRTPKKQRSSFPAYSRDQIIQITKDHLKSSMGATDAELEKCKAAALNLPDDDGVAE